MHSKKIEDYKKSLKLTKFQRELIIGMLLGDAHLETRSQGRVYRLKVEQSIKQKEFVDWLYVALDNWTNQEPKERIVKGLVRYGFTTYSHGNLRFYGQQFYPNGKKVIPKMIGKLLTPLALAVWFMGDGSRKSQKHRTFIIHTLGYTKSDLCRVQEVLETKLGIKSSLHIQKGKYWRLYILSESANTFKKTVEPYVLPSMQYKLGNVNAQSVTEEFIRLARSGWKSGR